MGSDSDVETWDSYQSLEQGITHARMRKEMDGEGGC